MTTSRYAGILRTLHPTVCMHCDADIWPEDYHWYDSVQPEHCTRCAPETCFTCRTKRERFGDKDR